LNYKKRTVLLHPKNTELNEVVVNTKKIKFKPKKMEEHQKDLAYCILISIPTMKKMLTTD